MNPKYFQVTLKGREPIIAGLENQSWISLRLNHGSEKNETIFSISALETSQDSVKCHHQWTIGDFAEVGEVLIQLIDPKSPSKPTKIDTKHPQLFSDEIILLKEGIRKLQKLEKQDVNASPNPNADTDKERENLIYCSFCGKSRDEVSRLVAGPGVFICNECVKACVEILPV